MPLVLLSPPPRRRRQHMYRMRARHMQPSIIVAASTRLIANRLSANRIEAIHRRPLADSAAADGMLMSRHGRRSRCKLASNKSAESNRDISWLVGRWQSLNLTALNNEGIDKVLRESMPSAAIIEIPKSLLVANLSTPSRTSSAATTNLTSSRANRFGVVGRAPVRERAAQKLMFYLAKKQNKWIEVATASNNGTSLSGWGAIVRYSQSAAPVGDD